MNRTRLGLMVAFVSHSALASGFSHKVDLSARFDARHSYVNAEFGQRAELIDDFIDCGHSAALELEGNIPSVPGLSWFNKWVLQEGTSRFQLGIKWGWK